MLGTVCAGLLGFLLLALLGFRFAVFLGGTRVQPVEPAALIRQPEEPVRVERRPDGDLCLKWSIRAERVKVYGGVSPDAIDRTVPLTEVTGLSEYCVPGLDPAKRYYFLLEFAGGPADGQAILVAERHIPLQGTRNFRDLGGYRTAGGHSVRWGQVFRSDEFTDLTDTDHQYLERIGLRTVVDLRNETESKRHPDRLPASLGDGYHNCPVYDLEKNNDMMSIVLFRRHEMGDTLGRGYIQLLDEGAPAYAELMRQVAKGHPLAFHCAAGKDRAGIGAALILSLLGVPEETIVADYSLSNRAFDYFFQKFIRKQRLSRFGVPDRDMRVVFMVDPRWMENLLAYLRQTYGSIENYLIHKAGLEPEIIDSIRRQLLV